MRRAHQHRTITAPLDRHLARPELHRPQRRTLLLLFALGEHDQLRATFGARFSRKALSRALASSSPCAIAAARASVTKPAAGSLPAIRGSTCMAAKLVKGALSATRWASSRPLAKPWPSSTRYCDSPIAWPSSADSVR